MRIKLSWLFLLFCWIVNASMSDGHAQCLDSSGKNTQQVEHALIDNLESWILSQGQGNPNQSPAALSAEPHILAKEILDIIDDENNALIEERRQLSGGAVSYLIRKDKKRLAPVLFAKNDFVVKDMCPSCYNGPGTEDFIERARVIAAAVISKFCSKDPNSNCTTYITALLHDCTILITNFASINVKAMRKRGSGLKHFQKQAAVATTFLRKFTSLITDYIATEFHHYDFDAEALRAVENEYVSDKRGRPTLINRYAIDQKSGNKFISMHRPVEEKTLNSATRVRDGLPNFVEASFSIMDGNQTIKPLWKGLRHSSYPPIAINDETERHAIAIKNVRQLISKLVNDYKEAHQGECPQEIFLSTMMLLTPTNLDSLRGFESEERQVTESYTALRTFDHRPIEVAGCKAVIPKMTIMNVSVNKIQTTLVGKMTKTDDESKINARGVDKYRESVDTYLAQNLYEIKKSASGMPQLEEIAELHNTIYYLESEDTSGSSYRIGLYRLSITNLNE
ncbi:MAG: hypothetical protein HQK50_16270, partial [Oligoflexia bacterium]|nr:hypothetical protein [Oligoflexia bacterium]